ncbi:telomere stability and silencing-domain-containing protein [Aspergillus filifer]
MASHVNVLLSSFPGLSLPSTVSFALSSTSTILDLCDKVSLYIPSSVPLQSLVLTTTNNKQLIPSSRAISDLLSQNDDTPSTLLPLRLSVPMCGGKGGFGSQLRAAGGRMSSRRKRNQGDDNGSSRNLDGRRLRTVNEAKALAEYLAVKPEMDKKEKEERRRRWEAVVDAAEKRQEEIKNGGGKQKIDGQWMEDKDEMNEKAREAVLAAMKEGTWTDNLKDAILGGSSTSASEGSGQESASGSEESDEEEIEMEDAPVPTKASPRKYIGFDEDDEFMRWRFLRSYQQPARLVISQHASTRILRRTNISGFDSTNLQLRKFSTETFDAAQSTESIQPQPVKAAIPTCCPGCGAYSQTIEPSEPGYYSKTRKQTRKLLSEAQSESLEEPGRREALATIEEVVSEEPDGAPRIKGSAEIRRARNTVGEYLAKSTSPVQVCDRCHDLLHHNKAVAAVSPTIHSIGAYLDESPHSKNHVYHVVDAADFPMSLIDGIYEELGIQEQRSRNRRATLEKYKHGRKMTQISFVITRSDLLAPIKEQVDSKMEYVRSVLREKLNLSAEEFRLGNVHMISSHRGWWTKKIKEEMRRAGGGIWIVGKVNAGKSSFVESCLPKDSRNLEKMAELVARRSEDTNTPCVQDEPDIDTDSLLPPRPREDLYPVLPVVSSLPGTTVSPIRIPFGRGKGELIDLPGLDRGNLSDYVVNEHKRDLIMTKRGKPERYTIKPGQSLLLGGGLVRITPTDPNHIIIAACFLPIEAHLTNTEKAKEMQAEKRTYPGTKYLKPGTGASISSAGTFVLKWDITQSHMPIHIKEAMKQGAKQPSLPYRVMSADLLIEGVGWVELTAQIRAKRAEDSADNESAAALPQIEVFTPEGKNIGFRRPIECYQFTQKKNAADRRKHGARGRQNAGRMRRLQQ